MSTVEKRNVCLPASLARYIDKLVVSGGYASASEVVRAGLRALRERDATVERFPPTRSASPCRHTTRPA